MKLPAPFNFTRRGFLWTLVAAPVSYVLAACGLQPATQTAAPMVASIQPTSAAQPTTPPEPTAAPATASPTEAPATVVSQVLPPTPACGDDDEPTIAQTEGPYYTPNNPERTSFIEAGVTGTKMVVTGYVLDTNCQPVPQALLDFWHCDDAGVYDNEGYKLRGHFFSDANGQFKLETIQPGIYTGRTRHFHVKVQAPNQPILTTQLYFLNEPANERDGIFNEALLMEVEDSPDGKIGKFNFVLNIS